VCAAPELPPSDEEVAQTIERAKKALSEAQKDLATALELLHPETATKVK
jgi:hypothetical protein